MAIPNGATVALGGFIGTGFAEELALAIQSRFKKTKAPNGLTLIFAAGVGDGKNRGANVFGEEKLVSRVIAGHLGLVPRITRLIFGNKIEAYNIPQGVISQLFRDTAGGRPGILTHVGLHTFVDPRNGGGKLNKKTKKDIVQLMKIEGKEYLFYKAHPVHVALLRGTTADRRGNITMEKEALCLENLSMAQAARRSGGKVYVQVERVVDRNPLSPQMVQVPGILVDGLIVAKPSLHWQTFAEAFNPLFVGQRPKEAMDERKMIPALPLDERKVIGRRAAMFLRPGAVVNLGIGMPEAVAAVANEEGTLSAVTLTVEPGGIGGIPAGGLNFGASALVESVIPQPSMFDFYDGGGLDQAFLGLAEADVVGNVNVSRFGPRLAGSGGFINISQNCRELFFLGSFMSGGFECKIENGKLRIVKEGKTRKFVKKVEHLTFSGDLARKSKRPVTFITERAVFKLLGSGGLELTEVAPGVDLQRDVLRHMEFKPKIAKELKLMDSRIFRPAVMGLLEGATKGSS